MAFNAIPARGWKGWERCTECGQPPENHRYWDPDNLDWLCFPDEPGNVSPMVRQAVDETESGVGNGL